jgi:hypothetical protein
MHLFSIMQQEAFHIHAITCGFTKPTLKINKCGFDMISIQVSFRSNSAITVEPLLVKNICEPGKKY